MRRAPGIGVSNCNIGASDIIALTSACQARFVDGARAVLILTRNSNCCRIAWGRRETLAVNPIRRHLMPKITPFLWFDTQAEEAANFYVSVFKNSKIVKVTRYGDVAPA